MNDLHNIFARNCSIRRIDRSTASVFLDANHRLGSTGGRYFYGMFVNRTTGRNEASFDKGTLVAVSSFSNARNLPYNGILSRRSHEWIRYASLKGTRVVGGMSRMLHHFISEVNPGDVMTYADPSWPDGGGVYLSLGFHEEAPVCRDGFSCRKFRLVI